MELESSLSKIYQSDAIIDYGIRVIVSVADGTARSHLYNLKEYESKLVARDVAIEEANTRHIRKFADSLAYRGARIGTIDGYLKSIKGLYNHLESEWEIDVPRIDVEGADYAAQVPPATIRKAISREKVRRLIEGADGLRDTVIVAVFYYTGLRRTEASDLNIDDIDTDSRIIFVRNGKGSKQRKVPYSEDLDHILTRWIKVRRPHYPDASNSPALFISEIGGNLSGRLCGASCYNSLMKAASRAGLEETIGKKCDGKNLYRVTPHILRHSVATHMVEDGVPLRYIQRILGHSSIQTTLRYAKEAENNVFQSYHSEFNGI